MDNAMRDVINAAREYGFYVYRGDPVAPDFITPAFTLDGAWHELDLSAIVPEHAHAVDVSALCINQFVNKLSYFRKHGQINTWNVAIINTQTGGIGSAGDITIPIDADRKIDYKIDAGGWLFITFTVKGWWF